MNVLQRLESVFRTVFLDDSLVLEDGLTADDVEGWDSITHINLIFAIEEEFRIRLATGDLEEMQDVGDLRRAVEKQLG